MEILPCGPCFACCDPRTQYDGLRCAVVCCVATCILIFVPYLDQIREHLRQQEAEVAARQAAEQEAAAAHAAQMQLAVAWERHVDEASGLPYWHNIETGETTWDNPVPGGGTDTGGVAEVVEMGYSGAGYGAGGALVPKAGGALTVPTEPHWVRTWSEDYGCYYYYNPTTMETSYQVPQGGFVDDATGEVVAV